MLLQNPGSKDARPGDVFEQLPTPVTAELRDIRAWHRWAALAGRHLMPISASSPSVHRTVTLMTGK
jgi:hypothetical protein